MAFGEIFGEILGLISIQTILISMELGSKNGIAMALKDDKIKKYIAHSLNSYLTHAVIAMFIMALYMYGVYGIHGCVTTIILNSIIIIWIYKQYSVLINFYVE